MQTTQAVTNVALEERLASVFNPDPHRGLPELTPLRVVGAEAPIAGRRLNVVLPVLVDKWLYGGIATALRFFDTLAAEFEYRRIILPHQLESEFDFRNWPEWVVDGGEPVARSIAFLGDPETALAITPSDYFLATFWTTAALVKQVVAQQAELFAIPAPSFVYLIQDYEPSFYPWSARYMAAKSTYSGGQNTIAVFNTHLLADYFKKHGHRFAAQYVFEPMLHPILRDARDAAARHHKERLILVYGRPSMVRNNFEMLVDALRIWSRDYADASEWTLLSAGEPHADIVLEDGVVLHSSGKLTPQEYASHLARTWVGVSLMLSPHPSYPPLEMAEFGAWVVTNQFENKNLSDTARNILSIDDVTPATIAEQLAWCCNQYQPDRVSVLDGLGPVFNRAAEEFPFAASLASEWFDNHRYQQAVRAG